jgi:hypothetical protein
VKSLNGTKNQEIEGTDKGGARGREGKSRVHDKLFNLGTFVRAGRPVLVLDEMSLTVELTRKGMCC